MVPIEQIICVWLVKLRERPTVENTFETNSVYWAPRVNCPTVRLNQYLQVKCSFSLTSIFKLSVHLYHYIQISCLCDSAWSCHRTFTTSWHTTLTSVPELGATVCCSPLHMVHNIHTATLGVMTVDCWWVFIKHRGLQYCQNYLPSDKHLTGLLRGLNGYFTQNMEILPILVSTQAVRFGFLCWGFKRFVSRFLQPLIQQRWWEFSLLCSQHRNQILQLYKHANML